MKSRERYPLQCRVDKENYQLFRQMYPHMLTAFVDRALAQAVRSPKVFDLIYFGAIMNHDDNGVFDV